MAGHANLGTEQLNGAALAAGSRRGYPTVDEVGSFFGLNGDLSTARSNCGGHAACCKRHIFRRLEHDPASRVHRCAISPHDTFLLDQSGVDTCAATGRYDFPNVYSSRIGSLDLD